MVAMLSEYSKIPRILRLNVAGQPLEWVTWQDAVCLYAREIVVWTVGDPVMRIRGGHSRLDGCISTVDIHSIIACEGRVVSKTDVEVVLGEKPRRATANIYTNERRGAVA